jgi:hypothetical protein
MVGFSHSGYQGNKKNENTTASGSDDRSFWPILRDIFYPAGPRIGRYIFPVQFSLPGPVAVYRRLFNFPVSLEQAKTDAGFISASVFIFDCFSGTISWRVFLFGNGGHQLGSQRALLSGTPRG